MWKFFVDVFGMELKTSLFGGNLVMSPEVLNSIIGITALFTLSIFVISMLIGWLITKCMHKKPTNVQKRKILRIEE